MQKQDKKYKRVGRTELICKGMERRLAGSDDIWEPIYRDTNKPAGHYKFYEFRKQVK